MPTVLAQVEKSRLSERHYLEAVLALVQSGLLEPGQVRVAGQPFQYQVDLSALPQGIAVEKGSVVVAPNVRPGVLVVQVGKQPLSIGRYLSQMAIDYDPQAATSVVDMALTLHRAAVLMLACSLVAEQEPAPELDVAAGHAAWPQLTLNCAADTVTLRGPSWSPLRALAGRLGANLHEEA